MTRVYLAAPYACRDALRLYADELARLGHVCASSWLRETGELTPGTLGTAPDIGDRAAAAHVAQDIRDVKGSDLLVVWTWTAAQPLAATPGGNSGGRHVETGVAMSEGIPVVVIGEAENIFHRATGVQVVPDWHAALAVVREHEAGKR